MLVTKHMIVHKLKDISRQPVDTVYVSLHGQKTYTGCVSLVKDT